MSRLTALLALLLCVALCPSGAAAQGCGSSDDSSSSSDSSDSCPIDWSYDDGGGSSSGTRDTACREVSDVLGHQRCRRFGGGWNVRGVPAFRLSLAGNARRLRVGHLSFRGDAEHWNETYVVGDAGRDLHDADLLAGGLTARLDLTIFDYVSVGAELSFASAQVGGDPRRDGDLVHTPGSITALGGGLVLGAGIPIDVFTLRPEVYLGGRGVFLDSETRVGDCVSRTVAGTSEWVVEPRLALEWFTGPWMGVSAYVGTNVLNPGELNVGLQLSLHLRSYDGVPSR